MLSNCEFSLALLVQVSQRMDAGKTTIGQVARAKAHVSKLARETVSLARECLGGNGIIMENRVMK